MTVSRTDLRLYNTLTRSIEPFQPREPGKARVYSCGPTVYSRQHLGNMRPYVLADLLTRVLRLEGLVVEHVINITDVGHLTDDADQGEDKLELAAQQSGHSALEVARIWTELFKRDLSLLDVREPTVWARATEHIPEQIEMIQKLEARGFTYVASDGVYFDTAKDPGYGALSRLQASAAHGRIANDTGKRGPADFALWKFSPPRGPRRQLEWPSPWGVGFPGWHIECSAMATKHLGPHIDIHTGGVDHVAVHHTNEIAQAENALDVRPWVQLWMHGAWLLFDGEKISKSRAQRRQPPNLDDLSPLGVTPGGFRYYLYTAHYRSPLSLSGEALRGAEAARRRLRAIVRAGAAEADARSSAPPTSLSPLRQRFFDALRDDLDAPRALATLWDIADRPEPLPERARLIRELGDSIGLALGGPAPALEDDALIERQVARRNQARQDRDFALSDAMRAELLAKGIVIEDSPEGSSWRRM
ncbi:MAG TPA: cysteine--tRNA ligase [Polyangiaceae bacterium]|nr:cysteine--tRNA ligase [Polyangiaceae bacterium]